MDGKKGGGVGSEMLNVARVGFWEWSKAEGGCNDGKNGVGTAMGG